MHARLFNRKQSFLVPVWIFPEPPAPVPLDKGNGGSRNEIAGTTTIDHILILSIGLELACNGG